MPCVALMKTVPVASASGSGSVPPLPGCCWTRKYPPAGTDPLSSVTCHDEPVRLAYCTDRPSTGIGDAVGLNSSTKSFVSVAPELPPPP